MTQKIIDYRTVSNLKQANKAIEQYENMYHCKYNWSGSYGEIEEAIAVCVLETEEGHRFVTTASTMKYIERREVIKAIDIGGL